MGYTAKCSYVLENDLSYYLKYEERGTSLTVGDSYSLAFEDFEYYGKKYYIKYAINNGDIYYRQDGTGIVMQCDNMVISEREEYANWFLICTENIEETMGTQYLDIQNFIDEIYLCDGSGQITTKGSDYVINIDITTGATSDSFVSYGSTFSPTLSCELFSCQFTDSLFAGNLYDDTAKGSIVYAWYTMRGHDSRPMFMGRFVVREKPVATEETVTFSGIGIMEAYMDRAVIDMKSMNTVHYDEIEEKYVKSGYMKFATYSDDVYFWEFLPEDFLRSTGCPLYIEDWHDVKEAMWKYHTQQLVIPVIENFIQNEKTDQNGEVTGYEFDVDYQSRITWRELLSGVAILLRGNVIEKNGAFYIKKLPDASIDYEVYYRQVFSKSTYDNSAQFGKNLMCPSHLSVKGNNWFFYQNPNTKEKIGFGYYQGESTIDINKEKSAVSNVSYYPVTIECPWILFETMDRNQGSYLPQIDMSKWFGHGENLRWNEFLSARNNAFIYHQALIQMMGWHPSFSAGNMIIVEDYDGAKKYIYIGEMTIHYDGDVSVEINSPCNIQDENQSSSGGSGSTSYASGTSAASSGNNMGIQLGVLFKDGVISGSKITDSTIENSKIKDATLTGSKFKDGTIEDSKIKDSTITGSKFVDGTIENSKIKDGTLTGSKFVEGTITDTLIKDSTITGSKIMDSTLTGSKFEDGTIEGSKIKDGEITDSKIADSTLTGSKFLDGTIESSKIKDSTLTGSKFEDGTITNSLIADSTITGAKIKDAEIGIEKVDKSFIEDLTASEAFIKSATMEKLTSGLADINTLIFGSATGTIIHTEFANAVIAQLGDAQIKSAMIQDISAEKIKSGSIYTDDVTIQSKDGKMVLSDNTMQISDEARVRVQIGKDASDDYSINIWDEQGNLMFSEGGITDSAIKSAIIRDDMVRDDADISASKINIDSLFSAINEDGSHTLKSSKIYVDEDKQTLDISFKNMTTNVSNALSSADNANSKIDNLDIGGRNLLCNSSFKSGTSHWVICRNISASVEIDSSYGTCLKFSSSGAGDMGDNRIYQSIFAIGGNHVAGKQYSLSFYAKSAQDVVLRGGYVYDLKNFAVTPSWKKYTVTYTPSGAGSLTFNIATANVEVWITQIKLEHGNKATDWAPAPEDTESQINTIIETITSQGTELNVVQGQISSKIWQQDITSAIDPVIDEVIDLTTQYSSLKQNLDGFKSEVGKTYATQSSVNTSLNNLQQQIDGAIETFTGSTEPTLSNSPASGWGTNTIKDTHIGDLYIVNSDGGDKAGFYYRFEKVGTNYQWTLLKDSEVTKALQDAKEANEKAQEVASNLASNYSTTKSMLSSIEQTAEKIEQTVGKTYTTKEEFKSLEIGGTNLALKTNQGTTNWRYSFQNGTHSVEEYVYSDGTKAVKLICEVASTGWQCTTYILSASVLKKLEPNSQYTISFDIESSSGYYPANVVLKRSESTYPISDTGIFERTQITDVKSHMVAKITTNDLSNVNAGSQVVYITGLNHTGEYIISNLMFEKGTIDSSWAPAPEDIQVDIESAQTIAEQTAEKFSWLVKSGTSSTDFTLTDRVASLLSEKFDIDALTTFKNSAENGTETIIDGGSIKTKSIKADSIDVDDLFAKSITATNLSITENSTFGNCRIDEYGNMINENTFISGTGIGVQTANPYKRTLMTDEGFSLLNESGSGIRSIAINGSDGIMFEFGDEDQLQISTSFMHFGSNDYFTIGESGKKLKNLFVSKINDASVSSDGLASLSAYGMTKLSNSLNSTSQILAATPYALSKVAKKYGTATTVNITGATFSENHLMYGYTTASDGKVVRHFGGSVVIKTTSALSDGWRVLCNIPSSARPSSVTPASALIYTDGARPAANYMVNISTDGDVSVLGSFNANSSFRIIFQTIYYT